MKMGSTYNHNTHSTGLKIPINAHLILAGYFDQ